MDILEIFISRKGLQLEPKCDCEFPKYSRKWGFRKTILFYMYECLACMCGCALPHACSAIRCLKTELVLLGVIGGYRWVLGTERGSFGRPDSVLNLCAMSLDSKRVHPLIELSSAWSHSWDPALGRWDRKGGRKKEHRS